jgi:hypothetical protein
MLLDTYIYIYINIYTYLTQISGSGVSEHGESENQKHDNVNAT